MLVMGIFRIINDALRLLCMTLCTLIYRLIIVCFDVFEKIGSTRLIQDSALDGIFNRISLILGLFMLFRLTFAFVEYIINPDNMLDKNKGVGNIIKKIIISIVLLGSVNFLFDMAFDLQGKIVRGNVIAKIVFDDVTALTDEETSGGIIASNLFTCFFRPNEQLDLEDANTYDTVQEDDDEETTSQINNRQYEGIKEELKYGIFMGAESVVTSKVRINGKKEYAFDFDGGGIASVALGLAALYLIATYTLQVAVRLFQLAYLQIISPIPIMMYIAPKGEDNLKKWGKQCLTTFLDFFIRTAIMFFIVKIISIIVEDFNNGSISTSGLWQGNILVNAYILAVLIIGLLAFAKKVPALLKEIFPSLGGAAAFDYGLDIKKTINSTAAPRIFGAATGVLGATASNAIHGFMNTRKMLNEKGGLKSLKNKDNLKMFGKSIGHTGASMIGGAFGGLRAGFTTTDITKMGKAVDVTNANREKRELKKEAGYTASNAVKDKVLGFAGETTTAEQLIKEAKWRQDAYEASRGAIWKSAEDAVKDGSLTYEKYASIRSFKQEKDKKGNTIWIGYNTKGDQVIAHDEAELQSHAGNYYKSIIANADLDKKIKDEGKKIKGLEQAKNDSKK